MTVTIGRRELLAALGSRVAARGARAAAGNVDDWLSQHQVAW
jgi:hypothetical protein